MSFCFHFLSPEFWLKWVCGTIINQYPITPYFGTGSRTLHSRSQTLQILVLCSIWHRFKNAWHDFLKFTWFQWCVITQEMLCKFNRLDTWRDHLVTVVTCKLITTHIFLNSLKRFVFSCKIYTGMRKIILSSDTKTSEDRNGLICFPRYGHIKETAAREIINCVNLQTLIL